MGGGGGGIPRHPVDFAALEGLGGRSCHLQYGPTVFQTA